MRSKATTIKTPDENISLIQNQSQLVKVLNRVKYQPLKCICILVPEQGAETNCHSINFLPHTTNAAEKVGKFHR